MAELFRTILEHAGSGFIVVDFEGRILDYNAAASRLMGRGRGGILQRSLTSFLEEQSRNEFKENLARLEGEGYLSVRAVLSNPVGASLAVYLNMSIVPWEEQARAILVIIHDARGLEPGAADPGILGEIIKTLQGGERAVLLVTENGTIKNPIAAVGSGEKGDSLEQFVREIISYGRLEQVLNTARSGQRIRLPAAWYRISGGGQPELLSDRYLAVEVSPMDVDVMGEACIAVLAEDKTGTQLHRMQERVEDQRASLSLFAGSLLQEINSLLGVIIAQASALRLDAPAGMLPPPAVGAILDAGQRAAGVLRRANEVREDTHSKLMEVDVDTLIVDAARQVQFSAKDRIKVCLHIQENLPPVRGDEALLRSMIVLLGSQVEMQMPEGEELWIKASDVEPAGPSAPPGIAIEMGLKSVLESDAQSAIQMEALFTSGWQHAGDAIGLAFVYSSVRRHRGKLELLRTSAGGEAWRVTLSGCEQKPRLTEPGLIPDRPVDHEIMAQKIFESATAARASNNLDIKLSMPVQKRRRVGFVGESIGILLVDDEENFRDFAQEVLLKAGYRVDIAQDGLEGLERFQKDPDRFSLVILDAYMPRLGGLEASLRMHVLRPDLAVLFISGFVRGPSLDALLRSCPGVADVALKPLTEEELLDAVHKVLSKVDKR